MKRLSLILTIAILTAMGSVSAVAQEAEVASGGGTIRGQIEDTTAQQNRIADVEVIVKDISGEEWTATTDEHGEYEITNLPTGRYLISIYRDGYGSREGKAVNVVAGGDRYFPLKMTKKDTIVTFFQKMGFVFWPLALCSITALTFIIERFFTFARARSKIGAEQFMASITDSLRNENIMEAVSTCEDAGGPLGERSESWTVEVQSGTN